MTIEAKVVAAKTVKVSVSIDNFHRYEFTVEVPFEVRNDAQAFSLTGTNLARKQFKLGHMGLATMELLVELGHATSYFATKDEGHFWVLESSSRRNKWKSEAPTLPEASVILEETSSKAK